MYQLEQDLKEEKITKAMVGIKNFSAADIDRMLKYFRYIFDGVNIIISFAIRIFSQTVIPIITYPGNLSPITSLWYVQIFIAISIGRLLYYFYYQGFKKRLIEFNSDFTILGVSNFLRLPGFSKITSATKFFEPKINGLLKNNSPRLRVIIEQLGFFLVNLKALVFSALIQFFIIIFINCFI
ncbi:MAG: hypothetical protein WC249_02660 [Patescibacteria group bacterium]|jgi:hypothetical protein